MYQEQDAQGEEKHRKEGDTARGRRVGAAKRDGIGRARRKKGAVRKEERNNDKIRVSSWKLKF